MVSQRGERRESSGIHLGYRDRRPYINSRFCSLHSDVQLVSSVIRTYFRIAPSLINNTDPDGSRSGREGQMFLYTNNLSDRDAGHVTKIEDDRLSVSQGRIADDPRESVSLSIASSTRTIVEEDAREDMPPTFERQKTEVVNVKLSWWDCMKAILFGPGSLRRRLTASVEISNPEVTNEKLFIRKAKCPFILTISVYPSESSGSTTPLEGRCVLDTACLQGNIISAEFAHQLGFTTYEPLNPREKDGGIVATGSRHTVSGALYLSWFHSTSAKIYRDMRFLVSDSAPIDLVIGTHSIVRHRLLLPPNLMVLSSFMRPPPGGNGYRQALCAHEHETQRYMSEKETALDNANSNHETKSIIARRRKDLRRAQDAHEDDVGKIFLYDAIDLRDHLPLHATYTPTTSPLKYVTQVIGIHPENDFEASETALEGVLEELHNRFGDGVWREEVEQMIRFKVEMIKPNHWYQREGNRRRLRLELLDDFMEKIPDDLRTPIHNLFDHD